MDPMDPMDPNDIELNAHARAEQTGVPHIYYRGGQWWVRSPRRMLTSHRRADDETRYDAYDHAARLSEPPG